jgi:hypothetical protein
VAARRFIGGVPMKPATNRLSGLVVELERRPDLLHDARRSITAIRSPIVIASTWSCVT